MNVRATCGALTAALWGLLLSACAASPTPPRHAPPAEARPSLAEILAELTGSDPGAPASVAHEGRPRTSEARPHAAPPLFGGTLLVSADGATAVSSDPDRDRVWITDLRAMAVAHELHLEPYDEPGQLAQSDDGLVHVVLRRGGALLSLEPMSGEVVARRDVCPAPRGVAARGDEVSVACAGGELVQLRGDEVRVRRLGPDLRDVGYEPDGTLWATRFRSAHMLRVLGEGVDEVEVPTVIREVAGVPSAPFGAGVAWRTIAMRDGSQVMLHQRQRKAELPNLAEYYGEVGGALMGAVTVFEDGVPITSASLPPLRSVLPIDAAPLRDGWLALVLGGDGGVDLVHPATGRHGHGPLVGQPGHAVAVLPLGDGLLVQYRDPAGLARFESPREVGGDYVAFGGALEPERGHQLFHAATREGVACASCHPEGLDDGHTWLIPGVGPRRTQSLAGGLLSSAPYHWSGELETFDQLMHFVFETRMGGDALEPEDVRAIGAWLDTVPDPRAPSVRDPEAVERGRVLFARAGCERCHSGPRGTDLRSHDVGTGGSFQTPPLVGLATRAPYLHDGCARTLEERFGRCHTPGHGPVARLGERATADLVAYLASR